MPARILPDFGQDSCKERPVSVRIVAVPEEYLHGDLVEYLTRTCPLSEAQAARVVADVLGYFSERLEEYVRRRHRELKALGLTNDRVFEKIAAEIPHQRYTAPEITLRQLRRAVYG
jgi:hypothetical protein